MDIPLQITFRHMESTPAVEEDIRRRVARLGAAHARITSCRVMVEAPHHHHHQGNLFHVRLDITVPGHEVVVSREPSEHHAHEDLHVALRDAFDAARRQLEEHQRARTA